MCNSIQAPTCMRQHKIDVRDTEQFVLISSFRCTMVMLESG